jgi:ATP-dependent DNA ligase
MGTESPQVKSYVAEPKNVGRANATTAEQQAELEAEALWKKKKRLKYFETVEEAQGKINLKPMLAQEYKKRKAKIQFPVSVQPKLDGYRCFGHLLLTKQVELLSRGGKRFSAGHVAADAYRLLLPYPGLILDGELYVHGMTLQNIGSLIKRPRAESLALRYYVYDCTMGKEETWKEREQMLLQLMQLIGQLELKNISIVDTFEVGDDVTVHQFHDAFVADGYEGAIIRTADHVYRFGYRSPGLLKLKNFEDKEFPIVDWTTDKDGTIMWVVRQEDGLHFPVRPMGNDNQRAHMMAEADRSIGKQLTVRFQGRTDKNIPKFARGLVREEWDI